MRRREFTKWIGAAASWPLAARARQSISSPAKTPRLGILMPSDSEGNLRAFESGLQALGYVEGQNIVIERRYGDPKGEHLRELATELIKLKVDVIAAWSTPVALAAQQATGTIPIVAAVMADPVNDGLVASLARPGGNITGTTFLGPELVAKRLQLFREIAPKLSRIAALWHPHAYSERTMASMSGEVNDSARKLGMELQFVPAENPDELAAAFSKITESRAEAFIVLPSPMLFNQYARIVAFAASNRLPAVYQAREFVDAGGLMSYGANLAELFRSAASFVDKIFKGAKPSELPVEQPTRFELVINLKTAKDLGLTINREFLLIADEVIE
ncbi:MAG TPA: ABC transporter substrate-binding protein [Bradyrhizobium sp.]|nr:ABC transporter substrate-binding protein [Bradyrhizobium sp.]